ncbi:sodium:solute symporter family protein [bacterium]|nr:sodium:solute symporter family protein [bacterium]
MSIYLAVVIFYLVVVIGISFFKSFFIKDQTDFMVGGRKVSTFMMVTTLVATWTGGGSLIGGAGLAYRQGFSELWMSAGAWIAIILMFFLAGHIRRISQFTLPDILEKRYNKWARLLGTVAIIIGCTTIVGYQLKGGAFILEIVTGIPWEIGVLVIAGFVILLTGLAGMKSIVSLDLLNGILITVGILVALVLSYLKLGGAEPIRASLPEMHFSALGGRNWIWAIALFFPTFFLLLGEPTMYQKFFSSENEGTAKKAVIGWIIGILIVDLAICSLAILGRVQFPELADEPEKIIMYVARYGLPTWAGCLLLAAALAVIFSTANSFLLTPATNLTHDIIQKFIAPDMSQKVVVLVNRIAILVLGVVAYILLTRFKTVLSMALAAYTMIGAGLTPAVIAAFVWKRVTVAGGVASILGGIIGTVGTKIIFDMSCIQDYFSAGFNIPGEELGEYIMIPAFVLALTLLIVVSLVTPKTSDEKIRPFFERG